jgi:hypothetical protein
MTPTADSLQGFRNRIINGGMQIDQRNAGASVTIPAASFTYVVDRWTGYGEQASKFSLQQSTTAPTGFINSLLATSLSAYSVLSTDQFQITQNIEGLNVTDLGWGTASAQNVTLSFWVRSSLTGTFGGAIRNSAVNRSYPFSFTINSANTFEYKTITISGDTSGTWLTTNGIGIRITFSMGAGSNSLGTANTWASANYIAATGSQNLVGTNGATFYITGVQLEVGSVATPFERRPYGTELALCQRYYYKVSGNSGQTFGAGFSNSSTLGIGYVQFSTTMRTNPSALEQTGTASNYRVDVGGNNIACSSVPVFASATTIGSQVQFTTASGQTTGQGCLFTSNATGAYLAWSAEL